MTRCPPLCGRTKPREIKKRKRVTTLEEEKIVNCPFDNKEDKEN